MDVLIGKVMSVPVEVWVTVLIVCLIVLLISAIIKKLIVTLVMLVLVLALLGGSFIQKSTGMKVENGSLYVVAGEGEEIRLDKSLIKKVIIREKGNEKDVVIIEYNKKESKSKTTIKNMDRNKTHILEVILKTKGIDVEREKEKEKE